MAKVFLAETEWNSQFRGKQNAPEDGEIAGVGISKGQSKSNFIAAFTANQFPKDEVVNTPALNAMIGAKQKSAAPKPTKTDQITGTPDLTGGQPAYVPPSGVTIKSVR